MNRQQNTKLEHSLAILILLSAGIQLAFSCYHAWPFTTDDAYISWRYAHHLIQGEGLRWNPAELPIEGYSNFLWVLLCALFMKLGLPIGMMMKSIACLSLIAALTFLYQLSRSFLSPLLATLPIYVLSHYIGIIWWTVSGLETSFFIALLLFTIWQATRAAGYEKLPITFRHLPVHRYNTHAWLACCLSLTLLCMTRFDGILWGILIVLFMGCEIKQSASSQSNLERHWKNIGFIFLFCFAVPYALYFAWRIYYFKQALPNSYAREFLAQDNFDLVRDYFWIALPCVILGLPYFFVRKDCRHLLLWLPSLLYALLLLHADPNAAYYNRLFLGAFALLVLLPILGVHAFFNYFHFREKNNALISTLVIVLFTYLFIPTHSLFTIDLAVKQYQQRSYMRLKIARKINEDVRKNSRVLLADCGIIPFFARKDIQFIIYKRHKN
jgi:hypothetical protein